MRYLFILFLFPFTVGAQCPDPDSVMARMGIVGNPGIIPPWYPGEYPWITPATFQTTFTWFAPTNGKMPLPPVNNDPEMGPKKWLKNGFCRIYMPRQKDTILLATGRYLNRKKTGLWTWYDENGDKTATGKYSNGLKTGIWKEYDETGFEIAGYYVAGRKQGEWKKYTCCDDPEITVKYKENYQQGLLHGLRTEYESNHKIFQGNYAYGLGHGKFIYYDNEGRITESGLFNRGNYVNNFRYEEGKLAEANYYTGSKQKQIYYEDGKIKEINFYKYGQKEGQSVNYNYQTDYKTIVTYSKNLRNGPFIGYKKINEQWVMMEKLNFKNDTLQGKQQAWYENGEKKVWYETDYKKYGLEYRLSKTGDTLYRVKYVNGLEEGLELKLLPDGKHITSYVQGRMENEKIYNNGELVSERYFRNWYVYQIKNSQELAGGKLKEEIFFADGKLKQERIFWPQGNDSLYITDYFPNGKIKGYRYMINHLQQGEQMALNEEGDTILYRHYEKNRPAGRNITSIPITGKTAYCVKTFYNDGLRTGKTQIYFTDSTKATEQQKCETTLLADGEMYKNLPFRHWTIYYNDGTMRYDGCLCGLNTNMSWMMSNPENNFSPNEIMTYNQSCGEYIRYYPSGKIQEKYQDHILEYYTEAGVLLHKGRIVNRVKQGTWLYYDQNGVKTLEEQYDNNGGLVPATNH